MFAAIHPLIETLHVAVHRDSAPSGLHGAVAIGVAGERGTTWLEVRLDGVAKARRVLDPSSDAARLLLAEGEASSLLRDGSFPSDASLGDGALLQRFAHRYLRRRRV